MVSAYLIAYAALGAMLVAPSAVFVPVPAQMIVLSSLVIFLASFNAAERERRRKADGENAEARDVISGDQAYRFPIVASLSLFSMFLAFKYLPNEWVSFALTMYSVVFGGFALANTLAPAVQQIPGLPESFMKEFGHQDYILLTIVDVISMICAAPVAAQYYYTKSWLANNILASALGLSAIDLLALGDFQSGAVLLSGLFFYDIFWVFGSKKVFGSNVMVSVAKNFEGPIKLVFPRFVGATQTDMSMLGLGDIVIPGLFIALMLRFDTRTVDFTQPLSMKRLPYFYAVLVAYVAGLVATILAMQVFNAAQPALLYLVPACLLTVLGMSVAKGELKELWTYTEEDENQESGSANKDQAGATATKSDGEKSKLDTAVKGTAESDTTSTTTEIKKEQ